MAAGFFDFEPADVADRPGGAGDGAFDGILDAGRRAADDFDDLVDVVAHAWPPLGLRLVLLHPPPLLAGLADPLRPATGETGRADGGAALDPGRADILQAFDARCPALRSDEGRVGQEWV